jgi:beta-1,4-N-acetylglucosaminyltransferase
MHPSLLPHHWQFADVIVVVVVVAAAAFLVFGIVRSIRATPAPSIRRAIADDGRRGRRRMAKTMVVLGSGGHTSEMMRLIDELDPTMYGPMVYVIADTDNTSLTRLRGHIAKRTGGCERSDGENPTTHASCALEVHRLPRAREVHQSYATSVLTTLHSFASTLALLVRVRPDLIIANGPGTCIPVIYASFLLRVLSNFILLPLDCIRSGFLTMHAASSSSSSTSTSFRRCRLVFVESVCRVRTLSLSGRLAYPIVDLFVVHWPYLTERYQRACVSDVFVLHRGYRENDARESTTKGGG